MERPQAKATNLIEKYSCLIFDCDGVLWRGKEPVPMAKEFLHLAKSCGKRCFFLTNTSMYDREHVQKKLEEVMGFQADQSTIFTANSLTAVHIKDNLSHKKKAYVIGRQSLVQEVKSTGIEVITALELEEKFADFTLESAEEIKFDDIDLVVMGYDDRINYFKLEFAFFALQCGADLVSTNADKNTNSYAFPHLRILANGSLVASLECASGKKAFVAGKPNPQIFNMISGIHNLEKEECLFVGDNLHTDIMFANGAGLDSLLVLTGVTEAHTLDELLLAEDSGKPTFIATDLS